MTANQVVDALVEAGPIDPGQFLSDFPLKRTQSGDFQKVIQRLLQLKQENGGVWSDTGDIHVMTFGVINIEQFRPTWMMAPGWQPFIDFDAVVLTSDGRTVGPGQAGNDTFFGWSGYLSFESEVGGDDFGPDGSTESVPVTIHVGFGTNSPEGGFSEEELPPEALEICKANWEEFKTKFIDQVMWLQEAQKPTWGNKGKNQPTDQGFVQISGDFGSPWDYGGTWFNEKTSDLIHFPGLDSEQAKEISYDSKLVDRKLLSKDYMAIAGALHLDDTDKWEEVEEAARTEHADQLTKQVRHTYYRTQVETDEWIEKDWAKQIAEIKEDCQISDEDWAALPPAAKESHIADRIGWEEFDHYPQKITKAELSLLLGVDL